MNSVMIHQSGIGAEALSVVSYGNGLAYLLKFGSAGNPSRDLYLQGDDATAFRDEFDAMETANPEMPSRDIWLAVSDPYL